MHKKVEQIFGCILDGNREIRYNKMKDAMERGRRMEREKICCFTGHRPNKLPWRDDETDPRCLSLKRSIGQAVKKAYDQGYRHFICGMAQGCDFYFCEAVQALRDERPGVTVEAAIPCPEQAERWPEADRARYRKLVGLCDFETVVQHYYDRSCMLRRNRYMVDRSALLIAAFDGGRGGTMYTITYALRHEVQVEIIDI